MYWDKNINLVTTKILYKVIYSEKYTVRLRNHEQKLNAKLADCQ